jgi:hypothetical protein
VKEIMDKLQKPFKAEEIEWRVGSTNADKSKGLALAYVTNRAIQNRLDEVFGCYGWQNQYKEWKGNSQICGISVYVERKLPNNAVMTEWITKWDGADDSQTEAVKGGLSDSMKRAAYQWGIGRYLYNLPSIWVDIKPQGKSFVIVKEPILPSWALPEGYKYQEKNEEPPKPQPEPQKPESNKGTLVEHKCSVCNLPIAKTVYDYSSKTLGKPLCMACQKKK